MSNPAQLRVITFRLSEVGRPSMAGPDMSTTYHSVWICLGFAPFPGLHISGNLSAPFLRNQHSLYAVSSVVLVFNPVSSPFRFICLGYRLSNALRGMTLPPALVLTFTQIEALVLPSESAGRCKIVNDSVFPGLLMYHQS